MTDEQLTPEPETTLQALREALDAAQLSMRILQEAGDHPNTLKAARATSDIAARIARLEQPETEQEVGGRDRRIAFVRQLLELLEDDTHPKRRADAVVSLKQGLKILERR